MTKISDYFGPFQSKYSNYDFRLIQDVIRQYYPPKSAPRYSVERFQSSPGGEKISALMEENFFDKKTYQEKWARLDRFVEKELNKPVNSTFSLANCCYSGEVVLEEDRSNDFVRSKKLHFYISVLGPFFSICGIDSSSVVLPENFDDGVKPVEFDAAHVVTVSPVFEYGATFNLLEAKLRASFPGYLFVPYQVGMSTIKNISLKADWEEQNIMDTVYEGLFGQIAVHDLPSRGDQAYGSADWRKPLNIKQKKLLELINKHTLDAANDRTIHKVWKFQEYKPLYAHVNGGMVGVELLDIIDLTSPTKAIVVKSDGTPLQITYKHREPIIEFNPQYYFKIRGLTTNTLTVKLTLHMPEDLPFDEGVGLELKFIQMKPRT